MPKSPKYKTVHLHLYPSFAVQAKKHRQSKWACPKRVLSRAVPQSGMNLPVHRTKHRIPGMAPEPFGLFVSISPGFSVPLCGQFLFLHLNLSSAFHYRLRLKNAQPKNLTMHRSCPPKMLSLGPEDHPVRIQFPENNSRDLFPITDCQNTVCY